MKILQAKLILVFMLSTLLLGDSCSSNENANQTSNNANRGNNSNTNVLTANDDAQELEKIIKLPFAPEEVSWRESTEDAKRKKILAVLRFSAQDAQTLIIQAEKYSPPKDETIGVETWFPAELIAQSQLSGDETLKVTTYSANDFFQNDYKNGKLSRVVDTNYFVLELTSN